MKIFNFIVYLIALLCVVECTQKFTEDELIIFRIFDAVNEFDLSSKCKSDLNETFNGYQNHKAWAIAMYDSSVKSPVGIEYGAEFQLGNFDQCMNISTNFDRDGVNIEPKYCLLDVKIDDYNVRSAAYRNREIKNSTLIHWAICVPSSCSNHDVIHFMKFITGRDEVTVDPKKCQVRETLRVSWIDILFGFILLSFLSIVVFCTICHFVKIYTAKNGQLRKSAGCEEIIKSFSIIENIKKLGKESNDEYGLSCVNGIKAVGMFCIIAGHALVFLLGGPMQNTDFYEKQSKLLQNAFILNSPLLVDSFLLLSGFLFTRLVLIEMDKRRGKINFLLIYIFRYIRLTPAYIMMIGLYSTWFIKIGDGPLWKQRISLEQERCMSSWWKNILYINNYYGNDALCLFQSWYLAADTQLFLLAPLLIYPLWRNRKLGLYLTGIVALISIVIPFYVTYTNNLDPTFMIFQEEISDLSANDYFINTYGKTHMRAISYIFGILAGYIGYYVYKNNVKIPKRVRNFMWIFSFSVGFISMYYVTLFYIPTYHSTNLERALYNCLHRLGWAIFTGWLVLGCVTSKGNALKSFFNASFLVPLSRLTYCAYLTNGFIELYLAASVRTPKYMSIPSLTGETLSHVSLTFLAALILCLMFESPIHGIEKILLRRHVPRENKTCESNDLSDCAISTSSGHTISTSEASA
ncbi:hypothetical protein PVAND_013672 [Polypedilum vanderplanki]|uniref:Nose resistant-to-fluoxetine protein N-terminal domain-containing protein n=1 Tax=Polypedilum vanderplanki TaxID=319348 RepID=A0A9J6CS35_POLVA|nr:hypothetical protein PVAND_013672 [Polypedilum vanderplanki]